MELRHEPGSDTVTLTLGRYDAERELEQYNQCDLEQHGTLYVAEDGSWMRLRLTAAVWMPDQQLAHYSKADDTLWVFLAEPHGMTREPSARYKDCNLELTVHSGRVTGIRLNDVSELYTAKDMDTALRSPLRDRMAQRVSEWHKRQKPLKASRKKIVNSVYESKPKHTDLFCCQYCMLFARTDSVQKQCRFCEEVVTMCAKCKPRAFDALWNGYVCQYCVKEQHKRYSKNKKKADSELEAATAQKHVKI